MPESLTPFGQLLRNSLTDSHFIYLQYVPLSGHSLSSRKSPLHQEHPSRTNWIYYPTEIQMAQILCCSSPLQKVCVRMCAWNGFLVHFFPGFHLAVKGKRGGYNMASSPRQGPAQDLMQAGAHIKGSCDAHCQGGRPNGRGARQTGRDRQGKRFGRCWKRGLVTQRNTCQPPACTFAGWT